MEIQLKKGFLDIIVLSALLNADSYGYKIIQDVMPVMNVSESTLYPILRRLEKADCLNTYSLEHNGRLRKYYKITAEGLDKIKNFLDEWGEMKKIYDFILSNTRI
ncbi:MAG: PadR family transcriptional regulator [Clostridia bacterium]|nr:PadR family transcriptional regulator [Clostridia bacterium]